MNRILQVFLLFISTIVVALANPETSYAKRNFAESSFVAAQPTKANISLLLQKGVRAIILTDANNEADRNAIFSKILLYLKSNPSAIISIIDNSKHFNQAIETNSQSSDIRKFILHRKENEAWPSLQSILKSDKRLVLFSTKNVEGSNQIDKYLYFTNFSKLQATHTSLPKNNENTLVCYNPVNDKQNQQSRDTIIKRIRFLWNRKGQKPHFVLSSEANLDATIQAVDSINKIPFYSGKFLFNGKALNNVHRMLRKSVIYNGNFTIPQNSPFGNMFTPWKEGYRFYPEIVKLGDDKSFQEITAIRLTPEDGLLYHFPFEHGIRNEVDLNTKNILPVSVQFTHDTQHEKVAVFEKEGSAIQCEKNNHFLTSEPFTISVWANPSSINNVLSVLGKGQIFSTQILNAKLSFSGSGFNTITAKKGIVQPNEWQHLCWICVPDYHIQFFLNGKLVDEQPFGKLQEDNYAITIGNDYSNKGFRGKLDDLRIWERALSIEEVETLYAQENADSWIWIYLLAGCAISTTIILFAIRRKKSKKIKDKNRIAFNSPYKIKTKTPSQGIFLFGQLAVINQNNENLSAQLTPKLRQLFLLLLLNEEGLTIQQINESLWPGSDEEKAKQNRNYSIQQIKKIIAQINGLTLEYHSKNWVMRVDSSIFIDIREHKRLANQIAKNSTFSELLSPYLQLIERGSFLSGINNECFDSIKANITDLIIESLIRLSVTTNNHHQLQIGNALLLHDSLNEEGLELSVKSLIEQGRNAEARNLYNSFCKRYLNTYNSVFSIPFPEH